MQTNSWEQLPMVLNTKQVATVLGVSTSRIYAMLKDGTLPKVQVGKVHKVYRDSLRDWLSRGTTL